MIHFDMMPSCICHLDCSFYQLSFHLQLLWVPLTVLKTWIRQYCGGCLRPFTSDYRLEIVKYSVGIIIMQQFFHRQVKEQRLQVAQTILQHEELASDVDLERLAR